MRSIHENITPPKADYLIESLQKLMKKQTSEADPVLKISISEIISDTMIKRKTDTFNQLFINSM